MDQNEITQFLAALAPHSGRTIVIVDFANVDKWRFQLGWKVGIQELARLVKHFSKGAQVLRRFYYGADCGPSENPTKITAWSKGILDRADLNRFEVVKKNVKYIHDSGNPSGYEMKCDLDVEMAVDMIAHRDQYDNIVAFSGDGDLAYVFRYLHDNFGKTIYVFAARGHVGKEIIDAQSDGVVAKILYVEDFQYRLDPQRISQGRHQGGKNRRFRLPWK